MSSDKILLCVYKLLCHNDQLDLLEELRKPSESRKKSRCKTTYAKHVPTTISWSSLQALLDSKVSLGGFDADIEYVDDEGECVAISGDDELREAVRVTSRSENKELKLLLYHYKRKSKSAEKIRRHSRGDRSAVVAEPPPPPRTRRTIANIPLPAVAGAMPGAMIGPVATGAMITGPMVGAIPGAMVTGAMAGYDRESGERHSDLSGTDKVVHEPPKWFIDYMEKFKSDITQDITDRVTRKTVKRLSQSLPELSDRKFRTEKTKEPSKKSPKIADQPHDAICDGCDTAIVGVRYKCGNCSDFDLCDKCESDDVEHDPDHVFLKLVRPAIFPWKRKGRTIPLLNRSVYHADPCKEIRQYPKFSVLDNMEIVVEKHGRPHQHKKRTEKLKRRHDVQRDAPYKREKLAPGTRMRAYENVDFLKPSHLDSRNYGGLFIRDDSIPDDTHLQPDTKFVKKWVLKNIGMSTWDESVKLSLLSSTLIHDAESVSVPALTPGEEGVLSVEMQAPGEPGSYESHWMLSRSEVEFGPRIWCRIVVDEREVLEARNSLEIVDKTQYETVVGNTETNEESGEVCIVPRKDIDESDAPLSYEIVRNEEDLLKVPQKASQTTTPNNTPLVSNPSTPPRSPAPELELAARKLGSACVLEAVFESQELVAQNVQEKMAQLTLNDLALRSSSESEEDSDSDYFVVPLPQCFDTSTRLSRSTREDTERDQDSEDCCSERSFDLISSPESHLSECKETALRMGYDLGENQPEIELQDLSERKTETESSIDIIDDSLSGMTVIERPELETDLRADLEVVVAEYEPVCNQCRPGYDVEEGPASEHVEESLAVVTEVVTVTHEIEQEVAELISAPVSLEIHPVDVTTEVPNYDYDEEQTQVKQPVECVYERENETTDLDEEVGPRQERSSVENQYHSSSPGIEEFVNAAFEVAGSAASQAIHAAKDVVSMLRTRTQYTPNQSTWTPPQQQYMASQQRWTPGDCDQDDVYSDISDDENVYPVPRQMSPMETLIDMGFANRNVNERLLHLYDNDINKVVTEILSAEGDWYQERH